jgi:hypothetical protein
LFDRDSTWLGKFCVSELDLTIAAELEGVAHVLLYRCTAHVLLYRCTAQVLLYRCTAQVLLYRCTAQVLLYRCTAQVLLYCVWAFLHHSIDNVLHHQGVSLCCCCLFLS